MLYAKPKELEEKIKNTGLQNKLKGTIVGGASSINKQELSGKTGDYGFDRPISDFIHYRNLSREYDKELGVFLHKNVNNPEEYGNDIRHQFVSAVFARNLGEKSAKILGDLNELKIRNIFNLTDSKMDKINNEIGRNYAKQYPNMPREQLLKLMLKEYPKNKQLIFQKMDKNHKNKEN